VTSQRSQQGLTLLEIMLALVIATAVIITSMKQIQVYMLNNDIDVVKSNVDNLFAAAAQYYRANCATLNTSIAMPITGSIPSLDTPATGFTSGQGFLQVPLCFLAGECSWYGSPNTLVNTSDPSGGYAVQFNISTSGVPNTACGAKNCSSAWPGPVVNHSLPSMRITLLAIQVSVLLKSTKTASYVKGVLGADCLSTESVAGAHPIIAPCVATTPVGAMWLVFTRLPSYASPQTAAASWAMMPMLKEFNLQYTHDQMYELSNGVTEEAAGNTTGTTTTYTCGE
jgi:hypothetical protein